MADEQGVRPRLGQITRTDGTEVPVRFEPTQDPTMFRAIDTDGKPVALDDGDQMYVDVIGPGQGVIVDFPPL